MTRVSVQDLKSQLSAMVAAAEGGDTILITRHGKPVARLVPADPLYVHRGSRVGEPLPPPIKTGVPGLAVSALDVLFEDRNDER